MDFLSKWLNIIRNCNIDNTYKMAWAKAITEIAIEIDIEKANNQFMEINIDVIARKIVKYYWEQTIFFDLRQGSNPLKPPKILSLTKDLICEYQRKVNTLQPVKYLKSNIENVCINEYESTIRQVITTLKQDVSYRFISLNGKVIKDIYKYDKGSNSLYMTIDNLRVLKDNYDISFEAINYRWAQILENFNQSPRICKKVRIIDIEEIKRNSLSKYLEYLLHDNPKKICFLCSNSIDDSDLSIDHVIPWSFLYSDDLWNLVLAHKGCNSSKSNLIPDEEIISQLEQRNIKLLEILKGKEIQNKLVNELENAIENNLVRRFWISCKG